MEALITCRSPKGSPSARVEIVSLPPLADDALMISVHAVALNPVDALYVAHPIAANQGRVVGSDIAGMIVATGVSCCFAQTTTRR
jgi:NADPH:quinone reductase-like Zn-dependent oxidoreductase